MKVGKNNKPMLTVLVEEEKLQRFRRYAAEQDMSMGAIINQLIDGLLGGKSSVESIESRTDIDKSVEDYVDKSIGINNEIIELLIFNSIKKQQKAVEVLINKSIETNNKSLEELIAVSIDSRLETLPPPLSLLDVDRLIGSVLVPLQSTITQQGAEIDRLSKIVGELMTSNNPKPPTTTAIQPPNGDSLAWGDFCELISEPLPDDRKKASGDRMVVLAESKGFNGWRYDGKTKKFTQPPNFSSP
jgi:hypothetical protein